MSEENQNNEQDQQATSEEQQEQFAIQKIYVKDISFESPNSPHMFTVDWAPEINLQLKSSAKKLTKNDHEVVLEITVTAKQDDKTGFIVEVQQAGVFTVVGIPAEQFDHLMGSYCPNILFPFAREAIADLVVRGGFPQLLLAPINFDAVYAEHKARAQQQQQTEQDEGQVKPTH